MHELKIISEVQKMQANKGRQAQGLSRTAANQGSAIKSIGSAQKKNVKK